MIAYPLCYYFLLTHIETVPLMKIVRVCTRATWEACSGGDEIIKQNKLAVLFKYRVIAMVSNDYEWPSKISMILHCDHDQVWSVGKSLIRPCPNRAC
jgi:hypothetical protein